jgi:hypothetical protein
MLARNALSGVDARAFERIFSSHESGWWRGKAFSKDFREGCGKDLCWGFSRPLACNRAAISTVRRA